MVTFSFNLLGELILVPVLIFGGGLLAFVSGDEKHAPTKTLIEWMLTFFALFIFARWVGQIWSEPTKFLTTIIGRNFLLPIFPQFGTSSKDGAVQLITSPLTVGSRW